MINIDKHKNILVRILKDIYDDKVLARILGFKGGTAALLFYNLDRFSVDLDFDLLDSNREEEILIRMEKILAPYGRLKQARQKNYTIFFEVSYSGEADQNVKVEVSRRQSDSRFVPLAYLGISMPVMIKEDMFANKLAALYERVDRANRDIYDVWFFARHDWPINRRIVEERIGLPFKDCLDVCIAKLEKATSRSILSGMGELLNEQQKAWARVKLRTETIFLLKLMRDN